MKELVYILGAGESGIGAALLAQKLGHEVWVSDFGTIKPTFKSELEQNAIPFEEGGHDMIKLLIAGLVVKSPGISEEVTAVQVAYDKGIEVISEIEFAARNTTSKLIAVTGTNGKTTTTSLCYDILKKAGLEVRLVGNIGQSFAKAVATDPAPYYAIEVSSFQLDNCYSFAPDVAILCNITPDHLDRYKFSETLYAESKFRIAQNQRHDQFFIYCQDDELTELYIPKNIDAKVLTFSIEEKVDEGAWLNNDELTITINNKNTFNMNVQQLGLQGLHNTYNSMAAAIMGNVLNIKNEVVRNSLLSFENIEHRLENVATIGGVKYVNDSKATNVNSAWYALESADEPVIWIAGGVDKGNDYAKIKDLVRKKVRMIICLGENNLKIHQAFAGDVEMIMNTTSAYDAVTAAYRMAKKGDTVLLSPACASFDLFDSYEDRGRQFKAAVKSL